MKNSACASASESAPSNPRLEYPPTSFSREIGIAKLAKLGNAKRMGQLPVVRPMLRSGIEQKPFMRLLGGSVFEAKVVPAGSLQPLMTKDFLDMPNWAYQKFSRNRI